MSEEKKVVNAVVKQEKLEDIIAYLRSIPVTDPISAICAPIIHALADRIEAAWKSEKAGWEAAACACVSDAVMSGRVAVEHTPVGNAAALREALELLNQLFDSCVLGTHSDMTADEMDKVDELYFKTKAALAAPPRNCDRFADETDAQIAFLNEVWLISVTKEIALERDRFDNWTDEMRSRYAKWLFAPAEKGEYE